MGRADVRLSHQEQKKKVSVVNSTASKVGTPPKSKSVIDNYKLETDTDINEYRSGINTSTGPVKRLNKKSLATITHSNYN
jgi:hypothetical protein